MDIRYSSCGRDFKTQTLSVKRQKRVVFAKTEYSIYVLLFKGKTVLQEMLLLSNYTPNNRNFRCNNDINISENQIYQKKNTDLRICAVIWGSDIHYTAVSHLHKRRFFCAFFWSSVVVYIHYMAMANANNCGQNVHPSVAQSVVS